MEPIMRMAFGWLLLLVVAGCAGPSSRPADAPTQAVCESSGGVWHADRSHCEGRTGY